MYLQLALNSTVGTDLHIAYHHIHWCCTFSNRLKTRRTCVTPKLTIRTHFRKEGVELQVRWRESTNGLNKCDGRMLWSGEEAKNLRECSEQENEMTESREIQMKWRLGMCACVLKNWRSICTAKGGFNNTWTLSLAGCIWKMVKWYWEPTHTHTSKWMVKRNNIEKQCSNNI